ncbi:MAG: hypothetical protein HW419_3605 [Deltaproteobacteria bacterium]|nr:hypothetical protein [Deltaproteobacteria bacterium]
MNIHGAGLTPALLALAWRKTFARTAKTCSYSNTRFSPDHEGHEGHEVRSLRERGHSCPRILAGSLDGAPSALYTCRLIFGLYDKHVGVSFWIVITKGSDGYNSELRALRGEKYSLCFRCGSPVKLGKSFVWEKTLWRSQHTTRFPFLLSCTARLGRKRLRRAWCN